jgi:hypothetical protein
MPTEHTLVRSAEDPKAGMTAREIEQFLKEAAIPAIGPEAEIRVRIGWSGQITRIQARG